MTLEEIINHRSWHLYLPHAIDVAGLSDEDVQLLQQLLRKIGLLLVQSAPYESSDPASSESQRPNLESSNPETMNDVD